MKRVSFTLLLAVALVLAGLGGITAGMHPQKLPSERVTDSNNIGGHQGEQNQTLPHCGTMVSCSAPALLARVAAFSFGLGSLSRSWGFLDDDVVYSTPMKGDPPVPRPI